MKSLIVLAILGSIALVACQPQTSDTTEDTTTDRVVMVTPTGSPMASGSPTSMMSFSTDRTIPENVSNSPQHTTLLTAVRAAGLDQTLASTGPFTVFAPTNDAFNKLPAGTVDTLLRTDNRSRLTGILTYHAVAGTYRAADLRNGMTLKTVQGDNLNVEVDNGVVRINGAVVTTADLQSSNGVVHIIDTVLMPPSTR